MKTFWPKVSIVIPSYNKADMVLATLESVYACEYQGELEVILVDDKSTDKKTLNAYEKAKKKYNSLKLFVNRLKSQKVYGPASARNFGLAKASGKYLIFLDSDDLLSKNFVSKMVEFAESNPDVDFFYTDIILFDANSLRLRQPPKFSAKRLKIFNYIPVTCLYKTKMLKESGGFDTSIVSMEDWELILRLSLSGHSAKKVQAPSLFLYYRQNSPNSVNARAFSARKRITVRNQIMKKNKVYGLSSPFWNLAAISFPLLAKKTAKAEEQQFEKLPWSIKSEAKKLVKEAISSER